MFVFSSHRYWKFISFIKVILFLLDACSISLHLNWILLVHYKNIMWILGCSIGSINLCDILSSRILSETQESSQNLKRALKTPRSLSDSQKRAKKMLSESEEKFPDSQKYISRFPKSSQNLKKTLRVSEQLLWIQESYQKPQKSLGISRKLSESLEGARDLQNLQHFPCNIQAVLSTWKNATWASAHVMAFIEGVLLFSKGYRECLRLISM